MTDEPLDLDAIRARAEKIIVRCGTTSARPIFGLTDYGRTLWHEALYRLHGWSC